jgi:hypothetical protein
MIAALSGRPRSKHQFPEHYAKDEYDEEYRQRNEEKDLCDRPGSGGDSRKAKQPGDQGDYEEDDGPLDH